MMLCSAIWKALAAFGLHTWQLLHQQCSCNYLSLALARACYGMTDTAVYSCAELCASFKEEDLPTVARSAPAEVPEPSDTFRQSSSQQTSFPNCRVSASMVAGMIATSPSLESRGGGHIPSDDMRVTTCRVPRSIVAL